MLFPYRDGEGWKNSWRNRLSTPMFYVPNEIWSVSKVKKARFFKSSATKKRLLTTRALTLRRFRTSKQASLFLTLDTLWRTHSRRRGFRGEGERRRREQKTERKGRRVEAHVLKKGGLSLRKVWLVFSQQIDLNRIVPSFVEVIMSAVFEQTCPSFKDLCGSFYSRIKKLNIDFGNWIYCSPHVTHAPVRILALYTLVDPPMPINLSRYKLYTTNINYLFSQVGWILHLFPF